MTAPELGAGAVGTTFEVVTSGFVGNRERGFRLERYPNGERFATKGEAIAHGFGMCGSDDFNVAELESDVLIRFWWMDDSEQFDSELREIADACGWTAGDRQ